MYLRGICIEMKLDPILRLLNVRSEKGVDDLPSGKVEVRSIELLKLQLELLGGRDGCEIISEYSMEDEIVSVSFHECRLLGVNREQLVLFHPG